MASYKHIFITGNVNSEKFKTPQRGRGESNIPARNRVAHSQKLLNQLDAIWQAKEQLQRQRGAEQIATREGTYISFTSAADHDLITKSLEDLRKGIRLLNIKEIPVGENQTQIRATVYVPNGKEGHFISKIQKYQQEETAKGEPKNAPLVNSIEDVSIALLEGLWTDNPQLIPEENTKWCEAWLNVNTKENQEQEQIAQFLTTLENIGIAYKHNSIIFPERAVLLVNANRAQLIELMLQSDLLAEFRAGQEPAGFWVNESNVEQQNWVNDLLGRIELVDSNVKVCLLDSGVNNGHQLLQPLIDDANTLTVDNVWGTDDHESGAGHGTLMAGVAAYGKMEQVLVSQNQVPLTHRLCSVKILPRPHQNGTPKELWGDITAQAIARAEIQNPNMVLVYCMSVTSTEDVNFGRPSSWSGAVDNLAYGDGENQRLIIVSAGNIRDDESWQNYPYSNFTSSVQNPAQAWNAVVAGAHTEKVQVTDPNFQNHSPVANEGELSPYSSTSLIWEKRWPVKPDVVFEGGNLLKAPDNNITSHEDLELLSTSKSIQIKPFDTVNATSAAAAQASWFAAKVAFEYPNAWAETIRGLMIHSADWNNAMRNQHEKQNNKRDITNLLRTFGFGVPNLDKALYSQESALTFIAQETIQPFSYKEGSSSDTETNEIHFFDLPWPSDLLLEMGQIPVKLRITLSYFIEPGAGEIGWKDKYRYQSHGLRFDVNNIGENEDDFRKRINKAAREEDEEVNGNAGSNRWVIGTNNRSSGSIHSDFWEGTAADLSTCNHIAVYPVIGWWRERKHLGKVENKTRYSLIISIETPAQDVELYTTVKTMIEVPVEIQTS
ncbi:S8 family peptidase [Parapedobacter sp. ISTM3]|uniref:S8 family peptidase n=1 Tax=Parapedobacter sp. ISTM3 TaxID=2800130 RepID=UPI001908A6FD|nr:S8 family peptidase [Parapedobacter sp. ISTM3]MBK1439677.1 S8 family peptidase [Parapedobacter sp. ISTM3]